MSLPPLRLGENEEANYEATTRAVKKALRLNRAIQAHDGHWPAENAGPLFFTPPLVSVFPALTASADLGRGLKFFFTFFNHSEFCKIIEVSPQSFKIYKCFLKICMVPSQSLNRSAPEMNGQNFSLLVLPS